MPNKITQLAWWCLRFAWLRNKILHGDRLTARDYRDSRGPLHKWVAEQKLREAIKEIVASSGHPELRLEPGLREIYRAIRADHG